MKYVIGAVVFVVVAVGAYYAWQTYGNSTTQPTTPVEEQVLMTRYATSTFSIQYPSNFSVNDLYEYEGVPNKPISGVKFTIPEKTAMGTNLSSDSGVSVEWLPRAKNCTADIFIFSDVRAFEMQTASTTYSAATTTGAAAGNRYEEHVYAVPESNPCIAVRYLIHSSNFANYFPTEGQAPEIKEFDRSALLRSFDEIRNSLTLDQ